MRVRASVRVCVCVLPLLCRSGHPPKNLHTRTCVRTHARTLARRRARSFGLWRDSGASAQVPVRACVRVCACMQDRKDAPTFAICPYVRECVPAQVCMSISVRACVCVHERTRMCAFVCPAKCDGGTKLRTVRCMSDDGSVPARGRGVQRASVCARGLCVHAYEPACMCAQCAHDCLRGCVCARALYTEPRTH